MKPEFASLMAQVIPVILLARVLQVKETLGRFQALLRGDQTEVANRFRQMSKLDQASWLANEGLFQGYVLISLIVSEVICIQVAGGETYGPTAQNFVMISSVLGTVLLGWALIMDAVAAPLVDAVKRARGVRQVVLSLLIPNLPVMVAVAFGVVAAFRG